MLNNPIPYNLILDADKKDDASKNSQPASPTAGDPDDLYL